MSELSELSYMCGRARRSATLLSQIAIEASNDASILAECFDDNQVAQANAALAEMTRRCAATLSELEGLKSKMLSLAEELGLHDCKWLHAEDLLERISRAVPR